MMPFALLFYQTRALQLSKKIKIIQRRYRATATTKT